MTTLEKIKLQKEYKGKRASVQGASTIAKVRLLREAKEILAQLKGTGVAPDPVIDPQPPEPKKPPVTQADAQATLPLLRNFIGKSQLKVMVDATKGEEGQHFNEKLVEMSDIINKMPSSYDTDGQGDKATAYLHYFSGGSDWYITEKDKGDVEDPIQGVQQQAFGYAILNGDKQNAESGYISIQELISNGVELDLYWNQKSLTEIKGKANKAGTPTVAEVGAALVKRGWKQDREGAWTISNDLNPSFIAKGSYLVTGIDSGGGNSGWITLDKLDGSTWVTVGRTIDLTGNSVDSIVRAIEDKISAEQEEPPPQKTDQDALNEMVKAILNKGGEVTGKQFPDVFFMFYGGVSAKLTAADGGYIGKNIDTGEQSSTLQTADQAMEWLISNAKENEAKQYQQNQKLTDLLSGKYDDLQPEAYLTVVQGIITEINDVEPVKPALVSYLDKAKAKGLITEAAAAAIEELLNQ